jgi:lysophospholipase L1-like esterase
MRGEARALGAFFLLLGGLSLALALLLNPYTLRFLYSDGRLVRDALSRIHTVQAGFALLAVPFFGAGALLLRRLQADLSPALLNATLAGGVLLYLPLVAELLLSLQLPGVYGVWDPFGVCRTSLALEDRRLGHTLNPALDRSYRINRRGLRGPDFDGKQPGERRILTVGDSITFGWEISDDADTYPGQLQALLDARATPGRRFRVINAGVPRYTSEQVLRFLQDRAPELQPDLVVACVGWNDLAYSYSPDWYPRISLGRGPLPRLGGNAPPRHCRTFSPALVRVVRQLKGEGELDGRPARHRAPNPGAVPQLRENLLEIVALLRARGVPLLLVNLPSVLSQHAMSERERELAALFPEQDNLALFDGVVRDVCRESGLACVLDAFPLEESGKAAYFYDHCHLNRAGNAILARKVLEAIGRDPSLARLLS